MDKFIPLFEEFVETALAEPTSGQRAAVAQGKDLVTPAQHALCYLIAKGKKMALQQPYNKIDSNSELAAHAGLNPQTAQHRVIEYQVLMGIREPRTGDEHLVDDRESEIIHKMFNKFENMPVESIATIANETFTPENEEIGMAKWNDLKNRQKASNTKTKMNQKETNKKIKDDILFNVKGMRALNKLGEGAAEQIIKKVAAKYEVPVAQVRKLYQEV